MNSIVRWTVAASMSLAVLALPPAVAQAPAKAATAPAAKPAHPAAQRTFASPDEAVKGFVEALRAADMKTLVAIIGPGSEAWIRTGDKVQDEGDHRRFLAAYDEKNALEAKDADSFILAIGSDAWPFAVPIVKKAGRWAFDAKAGREEITNRRVGRNELSTIRTLRAVVDAQREFATKDADGNGVPDYARRFLSTSGKKDGLYWPTKAGEAASPLERLVALATKEGYDPSPIPGKSKSFHGYQYRVLTAQGKDAPGGASNYVVNGKMTGGFAAIAYPSKYDVSGVMTFIVGSDGVVYEKDLGASTTTAAAAMSTFNPDKTWKKVQP